MQFRPIFLLVKLAIVGEVLYASTSIWCLALSLSYSDSNCCNAPVSLVVSVYCSSIAKAVTLVYLGLDRHVLT